jgi:hypothetical protein
MKQEATSYRFARMKRKYQWIRGTEILLWAVAIALAAFYGCRAISLAPTVGTGIALIFLSIAIFVGSGSVRLFSISEKDLAMYLNRHYPALKESADLLIKSDEELPGLQLLQKRMTAQQFDAIYPTIKLPHHVGRAIGIFGLSIVLSAVLSAFSNKSDLSGEGTTASERTMRVEKGNLPIKIKSSTITIFPPGYTQINTQSSRDFNLEIPEGSKVVWDITFEEGVVDPLIIFSARDSINLIKKGVAYRLEKTFNAPVFYQLAWHSVDSQTQYSSYYEIDVIKDHPPVVGIDSLNQFIVLKEKDKLKINLKATLADDYGLHQAQIVATVSKGSGEAIKFREERLSFDSPPKISGKNLKAIKVLDLLRLGLQPGDELYLYVEAVDNKTPTPNYTRTETYFIELQDTSSTVTSSEAGLSVDLMPEYFRSQRQIIIDSEKLLKEQRRISKGNFNAKSNDLAHDQKVLRLRYGEFLGEEFQSSEGPQNSISGLDADDVKKTFGHVHDSENANNQVEEKKVDKNPSHVPKESAPDKTANLLDDFVHAHDGDEEATFFIQSIRSKLKAAVTIMWDAELYLRLYQPEKSLPYQYQALKLLKEISQDSRIYVHRTGFDPPPLKEEKRLTGDLKEIRNSTADENHDYAELYPNIRASLPEIEKLLQKHSLTLSQNQKDILTKAAQELGEIELKKPGAYLKTLSLLSGVIHDEGRSIEKKNSLLKIRESFWNVLPQKTMTPQLRSAATHDLDVQFLKNLERPNL